MKTARTTRTIILLLKSHHRHDFPVNLAWKSTYLHCKVLPKTSWLHWSYWKGCKGVTLSSLFTAISSLVLPQLEQTLKVPQGFINGSMWWKAKSRAPLSSGSQSIPHACTVASPLVQKKWLGQLSRSRVLESTSSDLNNSDLIKINQLPVQWLLVIANLESHCKSWIVLNKNDKLSHNYFMPVTTSKHL